MPVLLYNFERQAFYYEVRNWERVKLARFFVLLTRAAFISPFELKQRDIAALLDHLDSVFAAQLQGWFKSFLKWTQPYAARKRSPMKITRRPLQFPAVRTGLCADDCANPGINTPRDATRNDNKFPHETLITHFQLRLKDGVGAVVLILLCVPGRFFPLLPASTAVS